MKEHISKFVHLMELFLMRREFLNCEKHPGKESSDDETEEIPYI